MQLQWGLAHPDGHFVQLIGTRVLARLGGDADGREPRDPREVYNRVAGMRLGAFSPRVCAALLGTRLIPGMDTAYARAARIAHCVVPDLLHDIAVLPAEGCVAITLCAGPHGRKVRVPVPLAAVTDFPGRDTVFVLRSAAETIRPTPKGGAQDMVTVERMMAFRLLAAVAGPRGRIHLQGSGQHVFWCYAQAEQEDVREYNGRATLTEVFSTPHADRANLLTET